MLVGGLDFGLGGGWTISTFVVCFFCMHMFDANTGVHGCCVNTGFGVPAGVCSRDCGAFVKTSRIEDLASVFFKKKETFW